MPTLRLVSIHSEFESGDLRAALEAAMAAFGVPTANHVVAPPAELPAVTHPAGLPPARELPAAGRAVEEKKKPAFIPPPSGERKSLSVLCREALMVGPKTTSEILASCQAAGSTASKQQVYGVLYNLSQNRRVERVEDDGKEAKWRLGK